jgi:predicted  nucleic acid-binding Zn-ribbon protein
MAVIRKIPRNYLKNNATHTPIEKTGEKVNEVIDNLNTLNTTVEALEEEVSSGEFENILVTDTATINTADVVSATIGLLSVNEIVEQLDGDVVTIESLKIKDGGFEIPLNFVEQETSIITTVNTTGSFGIITTVSSTLAAGTYTGFTMANALIGTDSYVRVTIAGYAGQGMPIVSIQILFSGQAVIKIANAHPSEALNNVLNIGFEIITNLQ